METKWSNFVFEKQVKKVFDNQQGRELIEFLVDAFVMRRTWVEGKPDTTAFAEGEKNVVLTLKQLLVIALVKQGITSLLIWPLQQELDISKRDLPLVRIGWRNIISFYGLKRNLAVTLSIFPLDSFLWAP